MMALEWISALKLQKRAEIHNSIVKKDEAAKDAKSLSKYGYSTR